MGTGRRGRGCWPPGPALLGPSPQPPDPKLESPTPMAPRLSTTDWAHSAPDAPAQSPRETARSPSAAGCPGGPRARGPSLPVALTRVEIVALVFQAQSPQALRVLIPEVGGHEDPVVVALATDIQGSGTDGRVWGGGHVLVAGGWGGSHSGRRGEPGVQPAQSPPQTRPDPAVNTRHQPGPPPPYLMATSVERVPMGLVSEISRSPRRL